MKEGWGKVIIYLLYLYFFNYVVGGKEVHSHGLFKINPPNLPFSFSHSAGLILVWS